MIKLIINGLQNQQTNHFYQLLNFLKFLKYKNKILKKIIKLHHANTDDKKQFCLVLL